VTKFGCRTISRPNYKPLILIGALALFVVQDGENRREFFEMIAVKKDAALPTIFWLNGLILGLCTETFSNIGQYRPILPKSMARWIKSAN
jgi:hypothetical protein